LRFLLQTLKTVSQNLSSAQSLLLEQLPKQTFLPLNETQTLGFLPMKES